MGIFKRPRKDGSIGYRAQYRTKDGRDMTVTFDRKCDARDWLRLQKNAEIDGTLHRTEKKVKLFKEHIKDWLDHIALRVGSKSYMNYENVVNNWIIPNLGHKKIDQITENDGVSLQMLMATKTGDRDALANRTNNKVIKITKQILDYFSSGNGSRRLLPNNPLKEIDFLPEQDREIIYWDREEVARNLRLIKEGDESFYPIILFAVNTGLRIGEIAALQVKRVNFKTNTIEVCHSIKRPGKTRKETEIPISGEKYWVLGPTKNKMTRHIPMNQTVRDLLKKLTQSKMPDDLIFRLPNGSILQPNHFCSRYFVPMLVACGIKKIIRVHDLRHTFASNFMMAGGQLFVLQKLLGHRDIESTMIYSHLSPSFLQNASSFVNFTGEA